MWAPSMVTGESRTAVLDNCAFLIGLDELYRAAMKIYEVQALLPSSRAVTRALGVPPASVPVEGYYSESRELTEYFLLMRALQEVNEDREPVVAHMPEFATLWEITNAPLFGRPQRKQKLLPVGRDPLAQALLDCKTRSVDGLVAAAYQAALEYDDFSLVGLAARLKDPVLLAALRESVVLYAEIARYGISETPQVAWRVDDWLAEAASRFIAAFNRFMPGALPAAEAANAYTYYHAYEDSAIIGRCVRIADHDGQAPFYHWAVAARCTDDGGLLLVVDDFEANSLWTTERYRGAQSPRKMRRFADVGVPEDGQVG